MNFSLRFSVKFSDFQPDFLSNFPSNSQIFAQKLENLAFPCKKFISMGELIGELNNSSKIKQNQAFFVISQKAPMYLPLWKRKYLILYYFLIFHGVYPMKVYEMTLISGQIWKYLTHFVSCPPPPNFFLNKAQNQAFFAISQKAPMYLPLWKQKSSLSTISWFCMEFTWWNFSRRHHFQQNLTF